MNKIPALASCFTGMEVLKLFSMMQELRYRHTQRETNKRNKNKKHTRVAHF